MVALYAGRSGRAIGLTAQNFKRVVIIPQGKFQEFLMLRDKERTDMMMELFGELRRYDLGGRVAYLEGETTRQVIDLRGQLTGLGEVSGEQLAERKQRYAALQEEITGVKKEIHEGQEQMERGKKVKQLTDERVARQEEERKLLEQREAMAGLQARMDEYERCLQQFPATVEPPRRDGAAVGRVCAGVVRLPGATDR